MTQDYSFTKHRIFQWLGIILAAGIIAVGYWWYQSQASTLNKSPTGSLTSGLVAYWTFDGADLGSTTATDRGSGSNNGTLTNTPGRVKGLAGQALEFFPNGSDSNAYVTMGDPGDGDLDFGSGDFSVVFWMKGKGYSSQGSSVNVPVSKKNSNAGGTAGYSFRYSSANQMIFTIGNGSTDYEITAPVATVADQVWHQYIGIRSGSTAYFYIDGGLAGSIAVSGSTSNSDIFAVGDDSGTERNVNAVIDEVRVYNTALTTAQLSSLYAAVQPDKTNSSVSQSTGTGRLDSGLALYWPLDDGSGGSVTDASTNGNTGTIVNDPTWTTGQVAGALDFKGGSYVTVADPATGVLDFADSTNFTLSGWFNRDIFTTDDTLIAKSNGQTASDTGYNVYIDDSTDKVTFVANDGTDQYKIESASTFTATGWHHFSLVWNDASSSETKLYINGALEAATTTGTFANVNSLANSVDFRINSESDTANYFSGKLDEMRVYSRSLSADEVGQLYRLTSPTGVDTSLKGYWSFNGQDVSGSSAFDRSGVGNTGTISGTTRTTGRLGQALSFDGSGDYVDLATDTSYNALTFATWFYTTNNSQTGIIFGDIGGSSASGPKIGIASGNFFVRMVSSSDSSVAVPTAGQWHFLVITRDGSNKVDLYLNGGSAVRLFSDAAQSGGFQLDTLGDNGGTQDQGFTGKLDETRVYNTALTAAQIKALYDAGQSDKTNSSVSQPQGTGRLDSGLAGYWALDNGSGTSATDSSTNGNTGTLTNGPTWTTGQIGGAVSFDGTDDYLYISSAAPLAIGVGSKVSTSFWYTANVSNGTTQTIYQRAGGACSQYVANITGGASTDTLIFYYRDNGCGGIDGYSVSSITKNTWHHVVSTYDTITGVLSVYVDGVRVATTTSVPSSSISDGVTLTIGAGQGGTNFFGGTLDEFRFYNRILSADEVSQLYRLTAPTGVDTSLKGYWSFNAQDMSSTTAYDRSGAGNTGTLTNGPAIAEGKLGQALSFDGSDDKVTFGSGSAIKFGSGDFSYAIWIKTASTGTNSIVFGENQAENPFRYILIDGSGFPVFSYRDVTANSVTVTGTSSVEDGVWHYLVGVRSGTTGYLYVDSVLVGSNTNGSVGSTNTSSGNLVIGFRENGAGDLFYTGLVDEARAYNTALTAAQIKALYDAGQSDKTNSSISQPQGTGRLDSGLAGYWPLDEGTGTTTADGSANANNGTLTNGPTWTTGQIGSAVDFDGSDDYIAVTDPASGVLDFNVPGNGVYGRVFSIAGWFNRDTFTTDDTIIAKKNDQGNTTAGYVVYIDDADDKLYVVVCGAACAGATSPVSAVSTTTYTATGWHHFVITVDQYRNTGGGDSRCPSIWVDGTPVTTNSCGEYLHYTGNLANSLALTIGAESDGGNPFDGKLDDIRIYNRPVSPGYIRDLYQNANPTVANDSSLKGYWSFDGAAITGTIAHDVSGFGNDGTLTNGPTITEGKLSQGISLDGVNDTVSGSLANVPMGNTIALWAKYVSGFGVLFSHDSGSNNGQRLSMGGSLTFTLGGVADYDCTGISGLSSNVWYFVAVTTTGNGGTMTCYAGGPNGTLTATSAIAIGTRSGTPNAFRMGNYPTGSAYFNGSIDEVRIYNRALGASEITALYNAGR
ncbi:MAG: LamG domain-containing protein [Candidatus Moraniibacteriota bacterium]|nr:MAG: LamG domain-containing protein [Candidatus Moranbacteria bacterium]